MKAVKFSQPVVSGDPWHRAWVYSGLGIALAIGALWPTLFHMMSLWTKTDSYHYAWLILPFLAYLFGWYYREELRLLTPVASFRGIWWVALSLALWLIGAALDVSVVMHLALILVVHGIAFSALGWTCYRYLFPLLCLLFFMIPAGDFLEPLLRLLTVKMIEWFAIAMSLPHSVDGYTLYIGQLRYVIINECAGLNYVLLAAFLGYCLSSLRYHTLGKLIAGALVGCLLGIACNGLRVNTIIWMDWVSGPQGDLSDHQGIQMAVMLAMLILIALGAERLGPAAQWHSPDTPGSRRQPARFETAAPVVCGALVLFTVLGAGLFSPAALPGNGDSTTQLEAIALPFPALDGSPAHWTKDSATKVATLQFNVDGNLRVTVEKPLPENTRLIRPRIVNATGEDWEEAGRETHTACRAERCIKLAHTTWRTLDSEEVKHVFYAFHVGTWTSSSTWTYRVVSGWNRLRGRHPTSGLISFSITGKPPELSRLAEVYWHTRDAI